MTSKYRIGSIILTFNQDNLGETGSRGPFSRVLVDLTNPFKSFLIAATLSKDTLIFVFNSFQSKKIRVVKASEGGASVKKTPIKETTSDGTPKRKILPKAKKPSSAPPTPNKAGDSKPGDSKPGPKSSKPGPKSSKFLGPKSAKPGPNSKTQQATSDDKDEKDKKNSTPAKVSTKLFSNIKKRPKSAKTVDDDSDSSGSELDFTPASKKARVASPERVSKKRSPSPEKASKKRSPSPERASKKRSPSPEKKRPRSPPPASKRAPSPSEAETPAKPSLPPAATKTASDDPVKKKRMGPKSKTQTS